MAAQDDRSHRGGTKGDLGRAERLAAELRANLKRRKAQSRGRDPQVKEPVDENVATSENLSPPVNRDS